MKMDAMDSRGDQIFGDNLSIGAGSPGIKWIRDQLRRSRSAGPGLLFPWESETDENGCHGFARRSYLPSQVTDDYGLS